MGGSLTSLVAWRVLSDTKKARRRAEEKEATETITVALLKIRQVYRTNDVGSSPVPSEEGAECDSWPDYLLSALGTSEAAVMRFRSEALRERITASLDLLIWGAHDTQLIYETRSSTRAVAYEAHRDAMDCLGAHMRGEKLPEATTAWKGANHQLNWQNEQMRRAEEGE